MFCSSPASASFLRTRPIGLVHGQHHRVVGAALFVGDAGELRQPVVGGLHRRVDGVEGQVEEPRLGLVPLDERHRLAAEGVGRVVEFLDRLGAAQDAGAVEVAVRAAEEAEELVEAALLRVQLRQRAEVPLADQAGGVAGRLEAVGERRLGQRQAVGCRRD